MQYLIYILSLSEYSSPREIPQYLLDYHPFNLLDLAIPDEQWKTYLGFKKQRKTFIALVMNSFIIYAFQFFYFYVVYIFSSIITHIEASYKQKPIEQAKLNNYTQAKRVYSLAIVHFPLLVILIQLCYYIYDDSIIHFMLFILTLGVIFYTEFIKKWKQKFLRHEFLLHFFKFQQLFILLSLIAQAFLKIPTFYSYCKRFECDEVRYGHTFFRVVLLLLLQLLIDLMHSKEFLDISLSHYEKLALRSQILGMAIAFEANNQKIGSLIERYQVRKNLKDRVEFITKQIDKWNLEEERKVEREELEREELSILNREEAEEG